MKAKLIAFGKRLLAVGAFSGVVAVISLLRLPRVLLPAAVVPLYPVVWFSKLIGHGELLPCYPGSLSGSVYDLARLAFPAYLIVSYLPAFGRWVWRLAGRFTRMGLRMPREFTFYFCAGAAIGALLGVLGGLELGLLWPEWGIVLCIVGIAAIVGWLLAIIRCTAALGHN